MKLNQVRQSFLNYFKNKNHKILPSSGLVPKGDDSLLFTNAGMVQFKDTFLGLDNRDYFFSRFKFVADYIENNFL